MSTSDPTRSSISVVVPVYNSELTLSELVKRLQPALAALAREYELVLVNDGSRDQSWKVVQELTRAFPWVRGINLMRNYGQHNALLCGIRAARFDILVTMDDDLQHPPEEIHKLLAKLERGIRGGLRVSRTRATWLIEGFRLGLDQAGPPEINGRRDGPPCVGLPRVSNAGP